MILLDTNLLLRQVNANDPLHAVALGAIQFVSQSDQPVLFPQNLYEFWATCTRPLTANGLGLSVPQTAGFVTRYKRLYSFLPDAPNLFDEWETLVTAYACHGRVSFDARLVAAMNTHGITKILTFNVPDFTRFPGITVIDPRSFLAAVSGS